MTGWPSLKLGDFFEIARGGSPRPIQDYVTDDPDGVNWITIKDASAGSKYIRTTERKIRPAGVPRSRVVNPGDFLLTNSMSFGRPYIMKTAGCIHDGWLVLSDRSGQVHTDFFYHLLGSDALHREFSRRAAGAVVKNLNIDLVKSVEVPLPPLAEQRRIADILDKADAIRRKRKEAIALTDELLRSTFLEMFGDPVTNPKGWPVSELAEVVEPGTTVTYGIVQCGPEIPGGVPYVRTGDIQKGEIDASQLRRTSRELAARYVRSTVDAGDIIMSIRATVGTTALVRDELAGANLTQGTARIAPGPNVRSEFLLAHLRSVGTQTWIQRQVKGATFREITLKRLRQLPVMVPSLDSQLHFEQLAQGVENVRIRLKARGKEADDLFNSLVQRAFRGEL